jgi:hypothetical protein
MPSVEVVDLSRLQFAVTALYHFLFVPLTLGLSWILVIMESVYVMTGREIYRDMTKFWGKLFGINFAMGTTGITTSSVRNQLGVLLALRGRYLRGAARARGPDGVLPGIDVRRPVLLRLDPAGEGPAPDGHVPRGARLQPVGAMDPDRERVDAEPGRRRAQHRYDAMELASFPACSDPVAGRSSCTRWPPAASTSMFVLGISLLPLRLRDPSFAVRSFAVRALCVGSLY